MNRKHTRTPKLTVEPLEDRCLLAAGYLDPTFDFDGVVTAKIGQPGTAYCDAVAIYPAGSAKAGKIVAVGTSTNNLGKLDFSLVRYNPNGSLDSTFGTGGTVVKSLHSNEDHATAVALVGDKILVGGLVHGDNTSSTDFVVARFNADGALDQTFGKKGKVVTDFGGSSDKGLAMAVQADGKVVLAGVTNAGRGGTYFSFAAARYTANGALDTTFGQRGRTTIDVGESFEGGNVDYRAMDLALSGDRIVLVGYGRLSYDPYVVQLTATGQLDFTFGAGGVVQLDNGYSTSNSR